MVRCCVPGCSSRTQHLFRFPKDRRRFDLWCQAIPGYSECPKNSVRAVCDLHFPEHFIIRNFEIKVGNDIVMIPRGRIELHPQAVPSIFPDTTQQTVPSKHKMQQKQSLKRASSATTVDASVKKKKNDMLVEASMTETFSNTDTVKDNYISLTEDQNLVDEEETKMSYSNCFVPGCKSQISVRKQSTMDQGVFIYERRFFHPPKNKTLRDLWSRVIARKDRDLTHDDIICDLHFSDNFILRHDEIKVGNAIAFVPRDVVKLHQDAVPSLCLLKSERDQLGNAELAQNVNIRDCASSTYDIKTIEPPFASEHMKTILKQLVNYRNDGFLCDVEISSRDNCTRMAHSVILAAASPIFQAAFNSECFTSNQRCIYLPEIDIETLDAALKYIYTGYLLLPADNATDDELKMKRKLLLSKLNILELNVNEANVLFYEHITKREHFVQEDGYIDVPNQFTVTTKMKSREIDLKSQPKKSSSPARRNVDSMNLNEIDQANTEEKAVSIKNENSPETRAFIPGYKEDALDNYLSLDRVEKLLADVDSEYDRQVLEDHAYGKLPQTSAIEGVKCTTYQKKRLESMIRNKLLKRRSPVVARKRLKRIQGKRNSFDEMILSPNVVSWNRVNHNQNEYTTAATNKCGVCDKIFGKRAKLLAHSREHGKEERLKLNKFVCETCGNSFAYESLLRKHEAVHKGHQSYLCDLCGRGFVTQQSIYAHLMVHNHRKENLTYPCPKCSSRFSRKSNLTHHINVCHTDKPNSVANPDDLGRFQCDLCKRILKSSFSLSQHVKRHSGNYSAYAPFTCNQCSKCFTSINALKTHELIHSGVLPYNCAHCSSGFRTLVHLVTHFCKSKDCYEAAVKKNPYFSGYDIFCSFYCNDRCSSDGFGPNIPCVSRADSSEKYHCLDSLKGCLPNTIMNTRTNFT